MSFGALTRLGIAKEAAPTTPGYPSAAATIAALLPVYDPAPDVSADVSMLATLSGYGVASHAVAELGKNNLNVGFPVVYEGIEALWACALGYMAKRYEDTVFPEEIVSGAYRHRYEMLASPASQMWKLDEGWKLGDGLSLDDRHARRLTIAGTLGDLEAWEWPSAMVQRLRVSGSKGASLRLDVSFVAADLDTSPATNTLAALQALPTPMKQYIMWHDGETRLAAYSASTALDSGDVVQPDAFDLTIETTIVPTVTNNATVVWSEPIQTGFTRISGSIHFENLQTTARILAQRAKTPYMLSMIFTGLEIGATGENNAMELWIPSMTFTGPQAIWSGAGIIAEGLGFECQSPYAVAAGFPVTQRLSPLIVQLVTSSNVHPLE